MSVNYLFRNLNCGNSVTIKLCDGNGGTDGCFNLMKSNQIDFMLSLMSMQDTIRSSNGTIYPLLETHQDETYIVTPYNCSAEKSMAEHTRTKDLFEAVFAFQIESRITFYSTIFFFMILLFFFRRCTNRVHPMARRYMEYGKIVNGKFVRAPVGRRERYTKGGRRKGDSVVMSVLRYVYNQPFLKSSVASMRLLILSLSMFQFFLVISLFRDSIESGQLEIYVPNVFRTFEEILNDESLKILYRETDSVRVRFESAPKGSMYNQLYQRARTSGFGNGVSWSTASMVLGQIPIQKVALIGSAFEVSNLILINCQFRAHLGACYFRTVDHGHEMSSINGFVASEKFYHSNLFPQFKQSMRKMFEFGSLTNGLFKRVSSYKTITPAVADCVSDSRFPVTHPPDVQPFGLQNYIISITILVTEAIVAMMVLKFERRRM